MKIRSLVYRCNPYRRFRARTLPIVFSNSFPKSGTHLLLQILKGFVSFGAFNPYGGFIATYQRKRKVPTAVTASAIKHFAPGDICGGHLHAEPEIVSVLCKPGTVNYFIFRDLRDIVISHAFYVTDINRRHPLHPIYMQRFSSTEERITASIAGFSLPELGLPNIKERFAPYIPWLDHKDVLSIRFKDLLSNQTATIEEILGHLESNNFEININREQAVRILQSYINPQQSKTFRSGKAGSWKIHFTPQHKEIFKQIAGDLLIDLDFEKSMDW